MAYSCPSLIEHALTRLTQLDDCGRPYPLDNADPDHLGANKRIQFNSTGVLSSISISPDIEAGADLTRKSTGGAYCVNKKKCDRTRGYEITFELCGIPVPLLLMTIGGSGLLDALGNVTGYVQPDTSTSSTCNPGIALDLWYRNDSSSCDGIGTDCLFTHLVFPKVYNWAISDVSGATADEVPHIISIKGYAEANKNWFPTMPDPALNLSWDAATNTWTNPAPAVLPIDPITGLPYTADSWTLANITTIQNGGAFGVNCVDTLPTENVSCDYVPVAV